MLPSLMYSLYQRTKGQERPEDNENEHLVSSSKQCFWDLLMLTVSHATHALWTKLWMLPCLSVLHAVGASLG